MFKKASTSPQAASLARRRLKRSRRRASTVLHHPCRSKYCGDFNVERARRQRLLSALNTRNDHPVSYQKPDGIYTTWWTDNAQDRDHRYDGGHAALRCGDGADRRKVCAERNRDDEGSWRLEHTVRTPLDPTSREHCIIEVNARLSRSSVLTIKATGYPLAPHRSQTRPQDPAPRNQKTRSTKVTSACFEPRVDHVVVKTPRWDLKTFNRVSWLLSSSMTRVGGVMLWERAFGLDA